MLHGWPIQTDVVIKTWRIKLKAAGLDNNITILKTHGLKKHFIMSRSESVQCIVDPGRQTQDCRPALEVLNLGLGTLAGVLLDVSREAPAGPMGLRSGALLNCLLACALLEVWRWEKVGDWTAFGEAEEKVGR